MVSACWLRKSWNVHQNFEFWRYSTCEMSEINIPCLKRWRGKHFVLCVLVHVEKKMFVLYLFFLILYVHIIFHHLHTVVDICAKHQNIIHPNFHNQTLNSLYQKLFTSVFGRPESRSWFHRPLVPAICAMGDVPPSTPTVPVRVLQSSGEVAFEARMPTTTTIKAERMVLGGGECFCPYYFCAWCQVERFCRWVYYKLSRDKVQFSKIK